ncbi:MAG: monovalent cation/H+ antiporter subunit D family protein [Acidobacteria bacterium]|nr:MAG: monovalent cation/H+ antiporter subunit D family protein [Acidobacteriota bacterium]REK10559.1 MAG: monovalent cation/H+ antiporter subunit D family protein [Acidobacteriota bacterium]
MSAVGTLLAELFAEPGSGWIAAGLLLPVGAALLVALLGWVARSANLRDGATVVVGVASAATVLRLWGPVSSGERPRWLLWSFAPGGHLEFVVEPLGLVFATVASVLWVVTSVYAFGYMRGHHEEHQTRFFCCFAIAIGAAIGVAFAGNLLTLFLFYELLTFSTFPLVTHHQTTAARRAGRVYFGILLSTSVGLFLLAIVWTWWLTGTTDFRPGGILAGTSPGVLVALLLLYGYGIGKAALMPAHLWLPAAMVAPTPVSALLHAVAVVKAGVFSVLKVVTMIFGVDTLRGAMDRVAWGDVLIWIGCFTVLSASIVALRQDNLKRRLAYSTIGQLAYIVLGAAVASQIAAQGAALHIVTHAVGKITLFFCAGAIYVGAHKTEISTMRGIGWRMPFTMGAFFVGSLSIIGLPPLAGAWSKWGLILGASQAGEWLVVATLAASSLLSVGYLLPVVLQAFAPRQGGAAGGEDAGVQEAPLLCVVPLCLTALLCVVLFFWPTPFTDLLSGFAGGPP